MTVEQLQSHRPTPCSRRRVGKRLCIHADWSMSRFPSLLEIWTRMRVLRWINVHFIAVLPFLFLYLMAER